MLQSLQIAEETDGDTDHVQGVRTQNCPVQVRVCLLSCAEEVFKYKVFGMLMLSFTTKTRPFVLLSSTNDYNS